MSRIHADNVRNFHSARNRDHQFNLEQLLKLPDSNQPDAGAKIKFEAITSANGKHHAGFASNFASHVAAAQHLTNLIKAGTVPEKSVEFHVSMASVILIDKKAPSLSQAFWLHRLATPRPAPKSISMDAGRIEELLNKAGEKLKFPAVVLAEGDRKVRIGKAGQRSKYFGSITIGGDGWYGWIKEGKFSPARDCDDKVTDLLTRFAADPAKVASEHGALTGKCCFCNSPLKDERSTSVGYGSTCAKNYGLPWGA